MSEITYSCDSYEEDDQYVDISILQEQVRFMRSKKDKSMNSTTTSISDATRDEVMLSSESDYQLSEAGIHSSDSEWSSGDNDVLQIRQRRPISSDEEDWDMPLIKLASKRTVADTNPPSCSFHHQTSGPARPASPSHPTATGDFSESSTGRPMEYSHPFLNQEDSDSSIGDNTGRGRKRRPLNRAEQKKRRDLGLSFVNRAGREKEEKAVKLGCGQSCSKKCHSYFNTREREEIFHSFWRLGDNTAQRLFLLKCVQGKNPDRTYTKGNSRRKQTIVYSFKKDGCAIKVCKKFFLDTLAIKEDFVYSSLRCTSGDSADRVIVDRRGKHGNHKKLDPSVVSTIKEHIQSFQTVESHYCRKSSTKRYLPEMLNQEEMYRRYKEHCKETDKQIASQSFYSNIFKRDFNLGFYRPKKDQCDLCLAARHNPNSVDEEVMREHMEQKELAREAKDRYKSLSKDNSNISCACFDLQKVLECPHGQASSFYYSRKLSVYNLTVYELDTSDGHCYMWPEHVAKRGANEIGSCLYKFLKEKANQGVQIVYTFSDNCTGQNRNKGVASMLWFVAQTTNIETITHTFLEKGHTQNENDSMHSTIEGCSRHATVYTPEQWYALVRNARKRKEKYAVQEMTSGDFQDFMGMASCMKNYKIDSNGENVNWMKIREIKVKKSSGGELYFKYDLGEDCRKIELFRKQRNVEINNIRPSPVLVAPGLAKKKKDDLIRLCEHRLIPEAYHDFYTNLPVSLQDDENDE